jgi:hypothetical protein
VHDVKLDRAGYARDRTAATSGRLEFRILAAAGRRNPSATPRDYYDRRLSRLEGLLVASSLIWTATPLTTARFYPPPRSTRPRCAGRAGVLTHVYTVEVITISAALTGIGKFTWGSLDYQGDLRQDKIYSVSGDRLS